MSATKRQLTAKRIRWAARIITLVITVLFLWFLIGETIMSIQEEGFKFYAESLFIVVPTAIAVSGCIVSWWRERVGGSLLILASIAFGIFPSVSAEQHQVPWSMLDALLNWLMLGSEFLIVGILFLMSSWLSQKTP